MLKYNPKTFMSSLQKCKSAKPFFTSILLLRNLVVSKKYLYLCKQKHK